MKKALIYIDPDAPEASLELTGVLDLMYGPDGYTVYGLRLGETGPGAPAEASLGNAVEPSLDGVVDAVLRVSPETVLPYDAASVVGCIAELNETYRFDAVLFLATSFGRAIAPRTAMRLHVGLVADVTEIRRDEERVSLVRPAFSGRMLASVVSRAEGPVMLTVRRNAFSRGGSRRRETRSVPVEITEPRSSGVRLIKRRRKEESYDIREAGVLVSGGGGVMRHFDELEKLASLLDGAVSASRRVVDRGKAPRAIQVGQSGKTVSPKLYIAVGISGSIQHVVGLKNAEYIIAVNSDRRAPICSLSDIVVEGDARTFLARLTERITRDGAVPPEPPNSQKAESTESGGEQ